MKWLKSTTDKSYTACGKIIPAMSEAPLAVNETVFEEITSMKVIQSLIATGGIIVLNKYDAPETPSAAASKLQVLSSENARLAARVKELEAKSSEATDASADVLAAQKAQAKAEAALAKLQKKYADLEAEANAKIAELSKSEED